jgi:3',5'-cyclic AMP phosphodiesterase CpdA
VGDWGTGKDGAIRVARAIRGTNPDHVVHLGDVYHTGTRKEVEKKFLAILRAHGPPKPRTKYWAIPGNHEMFSKGDGYYAKTLPFCDGQTASCFALENAHWRFIALDTAYHDHDIFEGQHQWLRNLVRTDPAKKKILISHHQVFSPSDGRPNDAGLRSTSEQLLAGADVFAWFWGHEHRAVIYEQSPAFGNYRARCIGHGGKDVSPFKPKAGLPSAPVRTVWEVPDPNNPARIQNGFALLKLDGAKIEVSYVDETGFEFHPEEWS